MMADLPPIDTSQQRLVHLRDGRNVFIQGSNVDVRGATKQVDLTQLPSEQVKEVKRHYRDVTIAQKGDRITLKAKGMRSITLQDKKYRQQ